MTSEVAPIAKAGGLADVSLALPKAINKFGEDIRVFLPYYGLLDLIDEKLAKIMKINLNYNNKKFTVYKTNLPNTKIPLYLFQNEIFENSNIYETSEIDRQDLGRKFVEFNLVVTHFLMNSKWKPDIVHVHDWPTSPLLPFIKQNREKINPNLKLILTIHNLAYRGNYKSELLENRGLNQEYIENLIESGNYVSFLRLGIKYANQVTTVSKTYAKEILTAEYGNGLEKDLKKHNKDIVGIVHGIDFDEWDPKKDQFIVKNYGISNLEDKKKNKLALQQITNLEKNENIFSVGLVSRLVYQKGIDLLIKIIPKLISENIQIFLLGTGSDDLESMLRNLSEYYPTKLAIFLTYNVKLSHQIIAGSDSFLVPSRYEPCGLTQMYAMRYGTVPIVRSTGGLADTVYESTNEPTGFVFEDFNDKQLFNAILRAKDVYYNYPKKWKKLQKNGMNRDLSWKKPAQNWIDLYYKLLKNSS